MGVWVIAGLHSGVLLLLMCGVFAFCLLFIFGWLIWVCLVLLVVLAALVVACSVCWWIVGFNLQLLAV